MALRGRQASAAPSRPSWPGPATAKILEGEMLSSASPLRRFGLAAATALLVAACGGSTATPTPAPTPVPTPTPSPTPVDVAAAVLKAVQASDYSASFKLEGTGKYGT